MVLHMNNRKTQVTEITAVSYTHLCTVVAVYVELLES